MSDQNPDRLPDGTWADGGSDTHTPDGKFRKGWKGGPGNPMIAKVASLRAAMYAASNVDDILEVMQALHERAVSTKKGEGAAANAAANIYLQRLLGDAPQADLVLRLAQIEAALGIDDDEVSNPDLKIAQ